MNQTESSSLRDKFIHGQACSANKPAQSTAGDLFVVRHGQRCNMPSLRKNHVTPRLAHKPPAHALECRDNFSPTENRYLWHLYCDFDLGGFDSQRQALFVANSQTTCNRFADISPGFVSSLTLANATGYRRTFNNPNAVFIPIKGHAEFHNRALPNEATSQEKSKVQS